MPALELTQRRHPELWVRGAWKFGPAGAGGVVPPLALAASPASMESGGNMQSSEERSVEKAMDAYLKSIGLHRKKIAKDGSCLFRAVAEQVKFEN